MANQLYPYFCSGSCNWEWPVKIAYINKDDNFVSNLNLFYWAQQFCQLKAATSTSIDVNMLITEQDLLHLTNTIGQQHIRCQVIIIRVEKNYFSNSSNLEEIEDTLRSIAEKTSAFAVLLVDIPNTIEEWLNDVMVHLSHNQNILEAIESAHSNITGIYNNYLDKATRLTYLMHKTSRLLYQLNEPKDGIEFQSKYSNQSTFTIEELSDFLKEHEFKFRFEHEFDEATELLNLFNVIEQTTGENILKEDFMEYLSPPQPSAAPPNDDLDIDPSYDEDTDDADEDGGGGGTSRGGGGGGGIESIFWPKDYPVGGKEHNSSKVIDFDEEKPRFLQGVIHNSNDETQDYLQPSTFYQVKVRIGEYDKNWKQGAQQFPSDKIFTNPNQQQEIVQVVFTSNLSNDVKTSDLILKRTGNTNTANFIIETPNQSMTFEGDILVYYKQALIQKARIVSYVVDASNDQSKYPPTMMDVVSFVNDLSQLSQRHETGSSILVDTTLSEGKHKTSSIHTFSNNKALHFNFTTALNNLIVSMKKLIQNAVIDLDNYPEDLFDEMNQKLLARLALYGNELYVNHFKMTLNFEGSMQIVSNQAEFIPLDFAYTCEAPSLDAPVCPNALKALETGICCGCKEIKESPAKVICPLGFYGFNHIVERHTYDQRDDNSTAGYSIIAGPSSQKNTLTILNNTLFASTSKMSANDQTLKTQLEESMTQHTLHPREAKDWHEWTNAIKNNNPDSLVLLVHIEKNKTDGLDSIEIGEEQLLLQQHLNQQKIKSIETSNPFVILIGCEVTDVQNYGFDLSSRFMNLGAAIVVTNFTKIRGRQAGPIVIKLLEFIHEHAKHEISLGEIILKLRRYLLAKGMMAVFSLQTFGDADWKIKT